MTDSFCDQPEGNAQNTLPPEEPIRHTVACVAPGDKHYNLLRIPTTTWIEIELKDTQGKPVAGEKYQIIAPRGRTLEGRLDENGFARVPNIPAGLCVVKFPEIDQADWKLESPQAPPLLTYLEPASGNGAASASPTTWIEIELKDNRGKPRAGERYHVTAPDGRVFTGQLDSNGFARLVGVAPGVCTVKFPQVDKADWNLPTSEAPPLLRFSESS